MNMLKRIFTCAIAAICFVALPAESKDYTQYVDPFIGADGGGYVFPGACMPYGMVKLGPDCNRLTENAGWQAGTDVVGFSHTHLNGSGGGCKYGNVLFMASTGEFTPVGYSSPYDGENAQVGLFSIHLKLESGFLPVSMRDSMNIHFRRRTRPIYSWIWASSWHPTRLRNLSDQR